jgi:hypothetical protein
LLNGAGWSPSGKYGASLNLDGIDDYVEVPNPALPTGDFSYSLWIKRDPTAGWRALFNGRDSLLEVAVNANAFLQVYMPGSPPTSTVQIPTNTWTHVAVTRSGSLVTIYVNGAQNTTGARAGSLNLSTCPFRIGVDFDNNQICAIPQPGLNG